MNSPSWSKIGCWLQQMELFYMLVMSTSLKRSRLTCCSRVQTNIFPKTHQLNENLYFLCHMLISSPKFWFPHTMKVESLTDRLLAENCASCSAARKTSINQLFVSRQRLRKIIIVSLYNCFTLACIPSKWLLRVICQIVIDCRKFHLRNFCHQIQNWGLGWDWVDHFGNVRIWKPKSPKYTPMSGLIMQSLYFSWALEEVWQRCSTSCSNICKTSCRQSWLSLQWDANWWLKHLMAGTLYSSGFGSHLLSCVESNIESATLYDDSRHTL